MTFLESLPKSAVEITLEDSYFEHNKNVLVERYNDFKNGKCKTYSIEEVSDLIDKSILEYEN